MWYSMLAIITLLYFIDHIIYSSFWSQIIWFTHSRRNLMEEIKILIPTQFACTLDDNNMYEQQWSIDWTLTVGILWIINHHEFVYLQIHCLCCTHPLCTFAYQINTRHILRWGCAAIQSIVSRFELKFAIHASKPSSANAKGRLCGSVASSAIAIKSYKIHPLCVEYLRMWLPISNGKIPKVKTTRICGLDLIEIFPLAIKHQTPCWSFPHHFRCWFICDKLCDSSNQFLLCDWTAK